MTKYAHWGWLIALGVTAQAICPSVLQANPWSLLAQRIAAPAVEDSSDSASSASDGASAELDPGWQWSDAPASHHALEAERPEGTLPAWLEGEVPQFQLGRLVVAGGLLLTAGVLSLLFLRWAGAGRRLGHASAVLSPELIGSLRLAPHVGLHVVQFQHHRVLVGVDRSGLKGMCLIQEPFPSWMGEPDSSAEHTDPVEPTITDDPRTWWQADRSQ